MKEYLFSENNSGGIFRLSNKDYDSLEKNGWEPVISTYTSSVREPWRRDMTKKFLSYEMAVAEWQTLTGRSVEEEGCSCCGMPFSIYEN